jgi:hypothetical protein
VVNPQNSNGINLFILTEVVNIDKIKYKWYCITNMTNAERVLPESVVESAIPYWLRSEFRYAIEKTVSTKHRFAQSYVPEYGFSHKNGTPLIDFTNRIARSFAYSEDESEKTRLLAAQSQLKVLTVAKSLMICFDRTIDGESFEELGLPPTVRSIDKTHKWIKANITFGEETTTDNSLEAAYRIVNDGVANIDESVKERSYEKAMSESQDLFLNLADFTINRVAELGYLPTPGLESGNVSEWKFAKLFLVGYPR